MRERERECVCVYKMAKAKRAEVRDEACDEVRCDPKCDARFVAKSEVWRWSARQKRSEIEWWAFSNMVLSHG